MNATQGASSGLLTSKECPMGESRVIIRVAEACHRYGVSRSTFYRIRTRPGFPRPVQLSTCCIGYVEAELDDWFLNRLRRPLSAYRC